MAVLHLSKESFDKLSAQKEKSFLVDFWAVWCGPCQMMAPVLEAVSEAHPEIIVGKVNVDDNQELAASLGIDSIPALFFYQNGKLSRKLIGFMDQKTLETKLGI